MKKWDYKAHLVDRTTEVVLQFAPLLLLILWSLLNPEESSSIIDVAAAVLVGRGLK